MSTSGIIGMSWLTDLQQLPDEGIHALSTHIITLLGKCRFPLQEIKEMMKLMVLQHAVKFHEACDWIWLQDQDALTYQSFLNYCTQLEGRCDQFKQAQVQGRAQLVSITSASTSQSLQCSQQPTKSPVNSVDTHILMQTALHSVKNATIATIKAISLPMQETKIKKVTK